MWLGHKMYVKYNVLAISYPLEMLDASSSSSFASAFAQCPHFSVIDWGEQVAQTTRKVIDQNHLASNEVILVAWSMAGKIVKPFAEAAVQHHLDFRLFVSLAATPVGICSARLNECVDGKMKQNEME